MENDTETELSVELEDIQIHNERLILVKPTYEHAGDYVCRGLSRDEPSKVDDKEFSIIKVRTQPYIRDFGVEMSHTGNSVTKLDGERFELDCSVPSEYGKVNITWLRSQAADSHDSMIELHELPAGGAQATNSDPFQPSTFTAHGEQSIIVESNELGRGKKLVIESVRHEHRGYYTCMVSNGVTEPTKREIYLRVKDKLAPLWPLIGIVTEVFILLTIIQIWETQRAYRESNDAIGSSRRAGAGTGTGSSKMPKRPASGQSVPIESVPLTQGASGGINRPGSSD